MYLGSEGRLFDSPNSCTRINGLSQANESKLLAEGAAGFCRKSDSIEDSSQLIDAVRDVLSRTKYKTYS